MVRRGKCLKKTLLGLGLGLTNKITVVLSVLKINGAPLNKNNDYLFRSQLRCVENGKFVLK